MPARRPSRDGEQAIACVSVHLRGESEMKIEMARYQRRAVFKAMATNGESEDEGPGPRSALSGISQTLSPGPANETGIKGAGGEAW